LPVKDLSVHNTPSHVYAVYTCIVITLKAISIVSQRSHQHQAVTDGSITTFNPAVPITTAIHFIPLDFVLFSSFCLPIYIYVMYKLTEFLSCKILDS
jgi:hypothetical protein